MAERLGEGLQNPLRGFESHSVLHFGTAIRANLCWHATCSTARANLSIKKIMFFVRLPLT
jgi:hypothetical protein